jgi:SPP1 family predicted phage head-tail adaptor
VDKEGDSDMIMRIGELNKKVNILQNYATQDTLGEPIENWRTILSPWAKIYPLTGKQYFSAQQVNSEVTTDITIRYNAQITDRHRIFYKGKTFEILAVINEEMNNKFLHLMCKEVGHIGT